MMRVRVRAEVELTCFQQIGPKEKLPNRQWQLIVSEILLELSLVKPVINTVILEKVATSLLSKNSLN